MSFDAQLHPVQTGPNAFICDTCGKLCRRSHDLARHFQNTHVEQAKCPVEGCSHRKGRKDKIIRHIRDSHPEFRLANNVDSQIYESKKNSPELPEPGKFVETTPPGRQDNESGPSAGSVAPDLSDRIAGAQRQALEYFCACLDIAMLPDVFGYAQMPPHTTSNTMIAVEGDVPRYGVVS